MGWGREQTKISLSPRTKLRSNPNSAQPTPRNGKFEGAQQRGGSGSERWRQPDLRFDCSCALGNPSKPSNTDFSAVATLCHVSAVHSASHCSTRVDFFLKTAEVKPDKYVTALKHKIAELEQKDAEKDTRISVGSHYLDAIFM
eukprot:459243-Hanusia_phi.AAC.1